MWQFAFDSLRSASRSRRVLQQVTLAFVLDRGVWLIGNAFRVGHPADQTAPGKHQQVRQPARKVFGQAVAGLAQRRRTDNCFGTAVVDDVGGLGGGQVGIDRHVVQPAAASRPHDRVHVLVVLHQDGHDVVLAQTSLAEPMRQPVGAGLQLVEADDRPGRIQDDGGLIGADIRANLHAPRVRRGPATRAAGRNSAHHQPKSFVKFSTWQLFWSILQASVKTGCRTLTDSSLEIRGCIAPCPWSTSG
ncbi:Uncharacterised protein [Mycobacterium tuberculosis]|uniref:Uncharacterized protein n=1 Tax=Mycobacterium tuberculosis TaxID=1773 RepID=A0A655A4D8_MYCTX|nr:Uncharacterised protein [Mycobacterium tuberculosis]